MAVGVRHATPESDPQLASSFKELTDFTGNYQNRHGIEPTRITPDSVHILSGDGMTQVQDLLGHGNHKGVYDSRSDVVYVQGPDNKDNTFDSISFHYAMAHEIGHKITPALNTPRTLSTDSFILREGLADKFAKEFISNSFLPEHAPEVAALIASRFGDDPAPYSLGDVPLKPEDLMYINPETLYATGFNRIIEAKIVDELESAMGPDSFLELIQKASSENTQAPWEVVTRQLGTDVWNLLTSDPAQISPIEVLRELRKRVQ